MDTNAETPQENPVTPTPFNPIPGITSNARSQKRAPSVKRAATKASKEMSRGFPLPLELTCTVTGRTTKYTSIAYIRKLIERYQGLENLKKQYVSQEGKKQQKSA